MHILYWCILGAFIGVITLLLKKDNYKVYPFYVVVLFAIATINVFDWDAIWWIMTLAAPIALTFAAGIIIILVNLIRKLFVRDSPSGK